MAAYVIAEIEVTDVEAYKQYMALTPASIARHNGRFLVRGGAVDALEGTAPKRLVVVAFDSVEAARRWYGSPDYLEARKVREGAAKVRLFIAEGTAPAL